RPLDEQQLLSVVLADGGAALGEDLLAALRAELRIYRADVQRVKPDLVLATIAPDRGVATDQAALALRCALPVQGRLPQAAVARGTGTASVSGRLPIGEVMDRAGRLLARRTRAHLILDAATAALLGPRARTVPSGDGAYIVQAASPGADESRLLLG